MYLRSSTLQMRKKHEASCDGSKSDSFVNGRPSRANQAGRRIRLFCIYKVVGAQCLLLITISISGASASLGAIGVRPVPAEAAALTRA